MIERGTLSARENLSSIKYVGINNPPPPTPPIVVAIDIKNTVIEVYMTL